MKGLRACYPDSTEGSSDGSNRVHFSLSLSELVTELTFAIQPALAEASVVPDFRMNESERPVHIRRENSDGFDIVNVQLQNECTIHTSPGPEISYKSGGRKMSPYDQSCEKTRDIGDSEVFRACSSIKHALSRHVLETHGVQRLDHVGRQVTKFVGDLISEGRIPESQRALNFAEEVHQPAREYLRKETLPFIMNVFDESFKCKKDQPNDGAESPGLLAFGSTVQYTPLERRSSPISAARVQRDFSAEQYYSHPVAQFQQQADTLYGASEISNHPSPSLPRRTSSIKSQPLTIRTNVQVYKGYGTEPGNRIHNNEEVKTFI